MMETLAENRFTITKALFYEGMLRVSAENYGKLAKKAILVLAAAWLVLAGVALWRRQGLGHVVVEFFVLILVALWIAVYVPRNKARRAFWTMTNKYGDELERVTRFYEDRLEVEGSGKQKEVFYSEIKQLLPSKNLLVLVCGDGTGIMLKLDGFTHGSEAAVRELIKNAKMEENEDD